MLKVSVDDRPMPHPEVTVIELYAACVCPTRIDAEDMAASYLRGFHLNVVRLQSQDGGLRWLLSGAAVCNSLSSLLELTDWKGAPALAIVGAGDEWAAVGDTERLPESVRGAFDKVLNTAAGLVSVDAESVTGLWREGIESEKQR